MQGSCRVCGAGRTAPPPPGPCGGCGALPPEAWPHAAPAPGLRVERDGVRVAVALPPEPSRAVGAYLVAGAAYAAVALLVLVLRGPTAFLLVLLGAAPFATLAALLEIERARSEARVEIRAGALTATSGFVLRRRSQLVLADISALFAARAWSRVGGFGATLVAVTRSGERVHLLPIQRRDDLVVSAERVLAAARGATRT